MTETVPVAPVITGTTYVSKLHMRCISIARSLHIRITFLSPKTATSTSMHVPFSLPRIMMSGLLLGMVLSVCTCRFFAFLACFYWLWYMLIPVFFCPIFPLFPCICWSVAGHTISYLFMCCSFASTGHADKMWYTVSSNCWHSLHLLSVSACNIFDSNTWYCTAISLSVSLFRSPFDSNKKVLISSSSSSSSSSSL